MRNTPLTTASLSLVVVVAILMTSMTTAATARADSTELGTPLFSDLGFLTGCWRGDADESGTYRYEHYSQASNDSIVAFVYTWRDNDLVFHEFIRISEEADGVWFYPYPGGRSTPVRFRLAASSSNGAEFVNPDHDFPQLISLIRISQGNELATLAVGTRNENALKVQYTSKKTECGELGIGPDRDATPRPD